MNVSMRNLVVLAIAGTIAAISARPYAGGYNDGCRLASVEALVDQHTWQIDHSIFSGDAQGGSPAIWTPGDSLPNGTGDKLYIDGHFYSDKPPVAAVLMAGIYQILKWTTGLTARTNPAAFCYWMTLLSSGIAYVIAVWCVYRMALRSKLPPGSTAIVTASFALATVAPAYARQVNASIILLAVASALMLVLQRFSEEAGSTSGKLALRAGFLTGFGYCTELASGPILLVSTAAFLFYQSRFRIRPVVLLGLGALPWLVGHHWLNYAIGGTFGPMNMVPEYFDWPNSTFDKSNLTGGGAGPKTLLGFLWYFRGFLVGARGFLCHDFVLLLTIPAIFTLIRKPSASRPLILTFAAWSMATLLVYALKSSDYSGKCIAVRWLVPTLAAGYLILAKRLAEAPERVVDVAVLSLCSLPISLMDWELGTFSNHSLRHLPLWIGFILASWLLVVSIRNGWLDQFTAKARTTLPQGPARV